MNEVQKLCHQDGKSSLITIEIMQLIKNKIKCNKFFFAT